MNIRTTGFSLLFFLGACSSQAPDPRTDDVPTRGDVLILVEEDFRAVLESQQLAFENIYPEAKVRMRYLPQAELLKAMQNDSVRAVFTTCLPSAEQETYFRTRSLSPDIVPVLTDGIALLRSPQASRVPISKQALRASLSDGMGMTTLFDGRATGVARSIVDSLLAGDAAAMRKAAALANTDSLVDRLRNDPNTIGLLAFARISDLDNPACRKLREGLLLCAVGDDSSGVVPNQSTLADGSYPLRRTLYAVVTEGKTGLGTGFVSFVAGHKGQRIILKSGLAPVRVPAREVEIVN